MTVPELRIIPAPDDVCLLWGITHRGGAGNSDTRKPGPITDGLALESANSIPRIGGEPGWAAIGGDPSEAITALVSRGLAELDGAGKVRVTGDGLEAVVAAGLARHRDGGYDVAPIGMALAYAVITKAGGEPTPTNLASASRWAVPDGFREMTQQWVDANPLKEKNDFITPEEKVSDSLADSGQNEAKGER